MQQGVKVKWAKLQKYPIYIVLLIYAIYIRIKAPQQDFFLIKLSRRISYLTISLLWTHWLEQLAVSWYNIVFRNN